MYHIQTFFGFLYFFYIYNAPKPPLVIVVLSRPQELFKVTARLLSHKLRGGSIETDSRECSTSVLSLLLI